MQGTLPKTRRVRFGLRFLEQVPPLLPEETAMRS
jgi:hypothetical protein